jgi:hypothetical protein
MKGSDLWISDAPSRLYHSTGDAVWCFAEQSARQRQQRRTSVRRFEVD